MNEAKNIFAAVREDVCAQVQASGTAADRMVIEVFDTSVCDIEQLMATAAGAVDRLAESIHASLRDQNGLPREFLEIQARNVADLAERIREECRGAMASARHNQSKFACKTLGVELRDKVKAEKLRRES